ncbi:MAG TPA: SUMF1/EgtB/PvdO family nonheme iron enzyme [Ktedonobacterales bacterium]|jgi:formylglycine-generating enzyme required for sulfatase activity
MSESSQTPQASPYKIFISYRRDDTQDTVGHIYYRLKERFGADAIFVDVDAIPIGYDFASYINFVLRQCRVVLIVMGPSWPTVVAHDGPYAGQPRLANPEDHVRIETEQALALSAMNSAGEPIGDLRLIPLLVQGASMPRQDQLSASLQRMTRFNSAVVQRYPQFDHDMQRLIGVIAAWIGADSPPPIVTPPSSSQTPPSADPIAELLARFLPQMRNAFDAQDWPQVARLFAFIQRNVPAERIPNEVYAIEGRTLMAGRDFAGAKAAWDTVRTRDPLDVAALQAAADARLQAGERADALPLLDDALTLTNDRAQRLPLLRLYATVLSTVARSATGASAYARWNDLLRRANEGLSLTSAQDADWLTTKLEALNGLGRESEALDVMRALTELPSATSTQWLMRARMAWKLAGETPTDEVRDALDAASRLAPSDATIAQELQRLLSILPQDRFPLRLAELGFVAYKRDGVAFIVPPVCAVPAGEFLMGSNKRHDRNALDSELPQHPVNLPAYYIARFPVTVAEYACFVEGTQHRQPNEWANQMQKLDHPVTYVSWGDAVVYTAWLAQMTGQPWRLPTEAEWEKAARWDAQNGIARLYPWGDTFDKGRCNTIEGGKVGTSAVGSYPNSASPCGAEEMAGNIWEWTHSVYKPYPYTQSDGRETANSIEYRVQRGGSWFFDQRFTRTADRYYNWQDVLNHLYGFRLLLAAPGSA